MAFSFPLHRLFCPTHPANIQTTSTQHGIFHHRNSIDPNTVNNADIIPHTTDTPNKKKPIAMNIFLNPYTTSRSSSFMSIIPASPPSIRPDDPPGLFPHHRKKRVPLVFSPCPVLFPEPFRFSLLLFLPIFILPAETVTGQPAISTAVAWAFFRHCFISFQKGCAARESDPGAGCTPSRRSGERFPPLHPALQDRQCPPALGTCYSFPPSVIYPADFSAGWQPRSLSNQVFYISYS